MAVLEPTRVSPDDGKTVTPPSKPHDARSSTQRPRHRPQLTRYDQDLLRAKNANLRVLIQLATEAYFAEEDSCCVTGHILEVDKYDIKVKLEGTFLGGREIWVKKSAIMGTEVFK